MKCKAGTLSSRAATTCATGYEFSDGVCWHHSGVPLPGDPEPKRWTVTAVDAESGTVTWG